MSTFYNTLDFIDGYAIYYVSEWFKEGWERWSEEKYNIINEKRVKQLEKDCDYIKLFSSKTSKFYIIERGSEVGLLSTDLREILPVRYYHIEVNKESDIIIAVKKRNELGGNVVEYIKLDGKIIRSIICLEYVMADVRYLNDKRINSDLFPPFTDKYCVLTNNTKKGIIDLDGKYVVPPLYEKLEIIGDSRVIARINSKYGLIDFNESILVDFLYDRMEFIVDNYFLIEKDNCGGVLNILKPENLKLKEIKYHSYSEGTVIVSKDINDEDELFGVEDYEGNELISFTYSSLSKFENGIAIAELNNKSSLINKNFHFQHAWSFDSIIRKDNGYFLTKLRKKYGLLNPDGSLLLKAQYSNIEFLKSCFKIEKDGRYNYLDFNGKFEDDEWQQQESGETCTQQELNDMYRDAFDGFPDAVWNVD